jgi:thioesterase domain-containing protein
MTEEFVPLRSGGDRAPLFCVHPVSGSPYGYLGLARSLPPDRPVYGVEAPGFEDGRTPVRSIHELSAAYVSTLRADWPDTDYRLLGWSMGGVIAFDMARRLVDAGASVPVLVLVDAEASPLGGRPSRERTASLFIDDLAAAAGLPDGALAADGETGDALFARVTAAGVFPPEVDAAFLAQRFAVFDAHAEALADHRPRPGFPGRVVLAQAAASPPRAPGWRAVADRVDVYDIPGDHHSIWRGDGLAALVRLVQRSLADADG